MSNHFKPSKKTIYNSKESFIDSIENLKVPKIVNKINLNKQYHEDRMSKYFSLESAITKS